MKKMKKVLAAALVGIMALGLLAGCGSSSGETSSAGETTPAGETEEAGSDAGNEAGGDTSEAAALAAELGSQYEGGDVSLSFWSLTTRQDGLEGLTKIWNEANPNMQVTVSVYSTDGIKDSCKTAAQSGRHALHVV